MKNILFICILLMGATSFTLSGEVITKKYKTSAECNSCKKRIEEKLNYTKGVRFAELDVPTKVLTVKFKKDQISEAELKKIVSNLGYDIAEVKANPEAYEALPACCKVGGMDH